MKNSTEKWIVCRVCLRQPKELMKTIFDNDESNDLTRMILECGGVPIKQFDHYPDKICNRCLRYLKVAYKFRVTCQRSHSHLSHFIAPVGNGDGNARSEEEGEEVGLNLEPTEVVHVKQELVEVIDDADIMDMYEPIIEVEENIKFNNIDELDECIDYEELTNTDTVVSDAVEYLDDIVEEPPDHHTSDEEYFPSAKATQKKNNKKLVKKVCNIVKPSTSSQAIKNKKIANTVEEEVGLKLVTDKVVNVKQVSMKVPKNNKSNKNIKPHECEICGYRFVQSHELKRHMNTHTGNRPYKCNYCPAAFADLSTRNKHHRTHTNERPYVCDVCGKSFTYTNTLKFHKMIHTGEKPFVCDICGKGFQKAYNLRTHKQTHAKKDIGKKFEKVEVEDLNANKDIGIKIEKVKDEKLTSY